MTAQDIINRARFFLKDDIIPYRDPDATFFPLVSDALLDLQARRPDLLIQSDGTFLAVTDITAVSDTINFPDRTREALSCNVAYRSYISEDADRHNSSQAAFFQSQYENKVQTI